MKNKKPIILITVTIAFMVICFLMDYFNVFSTIGLAPTSINLDFFGELINAAIVVILFIVSFYAIEKHQQEKADEAERRELKKGENIKSIVQLLINKTYEECLETLKIIGNKETLIKFVIPKVDFDKTLPENAFEKNLMNQPFDSYDQIIGFAESGHINSKELEIYLDVRKRFKSVIMMKTTFFDIDELPNKTDKQVELEAIINRDYNLLCMFLQNYLASKKE